MCFQEEGELLGDIHFAFKLMNFAFKMMKILRQCSTTPSSTRSGTGLSGLLDLLSLLGLLDLIAALGLVPTAAAVTRIGWC